MSRVVKSPVGPVFVIEKEAPDICQECGRFAELRPYGKGGKRICFSCGMKDREGFVRRMAQAMGYELEEN